MDRPSPTPEPGPRKPAASPPPNPPAAHAPDGGYRLRKTLTPQEIAAKAKAASVAPPAGRAPGGPQKTAAPPPKPQATPKPPAPLQARGPQTSPLPKSTPPLQAQIQSTPKQSPQSQLQPPAASETKSISIAPKIPLAQRIGWAAAVVVALIFTFSLFVQWKPTMPAGNLDSSWCMALHWAFIHGVDFGHDLVFTFGPWGFIWQGYHPSTYPFTVLGWSLFAAAFFAGALQLSRGFSPNRWVSGIWLFLVIAAAGANPLLQDIRMFSLGAMLLLIHFYVDDRPITWIKGLLTVALALTTLVKFSVSFIAVAAVLAVTIEQLRRRRIPWIGAIYFASLIGFWLGARQKLSSFVPYIYHSWLIVRGFGGGQAQAQLTDNVDITLFVICALPFLALLIVAHRKLREKPALRALWGVPAIAAFAVILLVTFKAGYVRHDGHEIASTGFLFLLSLLVGAALWPLLRHQFARGLMLALAAGCFGLCWFSNERYINLPLPRILWSSIALFPSHAMSALEMAMGQSTNDLDYKASLQKIQDEVPIPKLPGTVDIFPWEARLILANDLQYQPRPVLQSYLAYGPVLEGLNADFLRGFNAPQFILFRIALLDGRYPSQNDAFCWPELLTRYDVAGHTPQDLILHRSAAPRDYSIIPIKTITAALNDDVAVPESDDPIWVSIDLKPKAYLALRNALYKPPVAWIEVKTASGEQTRFQLIPDIARTGFLLSPAISDREVFAGLRVDQWKKYVGRNIVTDMGVAVGEGSATNASYESDYTIAFSGLHYAHEAVALSPATKTARLQAVVKVGRIIHADAPPRMMPAENGDQALAVFGNTQIMIPVPAGAKALRLGFAMSEDSYTGTTKSDGAVFEARAVRIDESKQATAGLMWTRKLDPAHAETDRGVQESGDIVLPAPAPPFVMIDTAPVGPNIAGTSCWTDVEFR